MTFEEIVEQAAASRARLAAAIGKIEARIKEIEDTEFERDLTPAEHDELEKLREDMKVPLAAIEKLALVTMEALDDTAKVKDLARAIAGIKDGLDAQRDRLTKFAGGAEKFAETLAGFKKVADQLVQLKDKLDPP